MTSTPPSNFLPVFTFLQLVYAPDFKYLETNFSIQGSRQRSRRLGMCTDAQREDLNFAIGSKRPRACCKRACEANSRPVSIISPVPVLQIVDNVWYLPQHGREELRSDEINTYPSAVN